MLLALAGLLAVFAFDIGRDADAANIKRGPNDFNV
jgi:hypothetical protein